MVPNKAPESHPAKGSNPSGSSGRGRFRIIGGQWRGRRLSFPTGADIRPSPDRVRETLFNWLGPGIEGCRCLDLFAGSGALGLEALSRGAIETVFVDLDRDAIASITGHLQTLGSEKGQALVTDAQRYLSSGGETFDVVFLDPPFGNDLAARLCTLIDKHDRLAVDGRVYLECDSHIGTPVLPAGWTVTRSGKAGQVGYHLAARQEDDNRAFQ